MLPGGRVGVAKRLIPILARVRRHGLGLCREGMRPDGMTKGLGTL